MVDMVYVARILYVCVRILKWKVKELDVGLAELNL